MDLFSVDIKECANEIELSIIVPCYNETATIRKIIELSGADKLGLNFEIIVIDDGSSDGSRKKIYELEHEFGHVIAKFHKKNFGKAPRLKQVFKSREVTSSLFKTQI